MIKIGKVIGDVIEAGGVKNVTNNYYGREEDEPSGATELATVVPRDEALPEALRTEQAEALMEALCEAELLGDDWQPRGLSGTERGELAMQLALRLEIKEVWQVFGRLWGVKPETLRTAFNKARDQRKNAAFQDRLKRIFDNAWSATDEHG